MDIEFLFFVLMIGGFLFCAIKLKTPTAVSMLVASMIGLVAYSFTSFSTFVEIPRHLIEGSFGYLDTILTISCAMIFMKVIEYAGTLDAFSIFITKKLHKFPTLLLICLMIVIMFPAMITGSSVTSVVSAGTLIAPVMLAINIPKKETTAIIALGAVLGMIAPPINIPAMVICDIVDMPYIGFIIPLLILTIPLAIFSVLFLGKKYVKNLNFEELKSKLNFTEDLNRKPLIYLPLFILIILMILVNFFPQFLPSLGMPLVFIISAIPGLFVGRKVHIMKAVEAAVHKCLPVMAMLFGVGMLIQAMTLNGVRGFIVYNVMTLSQVQFMGHPILLYLAAITAIPLFGALSSFGSASVFGGPVVMAFSGILNPIIVACALSLLASIGDLLPPTAIAGTSAASVVGDLSYRQVLKKMILPILIIMIFSLSFMVVFGLGIIEL